MGFSRFKKVLTESIKLRLQKDSNYNSSRGDRSARIRQEGLDDDLNAKKAQREARRQKYLDRKGDS